jgi:hypothetical protein
MGLVSCQMYTPVTASKGEGQRNPRLNPILWNEFSTAYFPQN